MDTHSPLSSSAGLSPECPRALAGRSPPPRFIAEAKLGVEGRPFVGELTRAPPGPAYIEPGRVNLEGERPPGGRGDDERGGGPDPVYFFCVRVREKMACEREDCAFMSVSLVRRMDVPFRRRLKQV
jgi:hypothetical protein